MQKVLIYILYKIGAHAKQWATSAGLALIAVAALLLISSTTWLDAGYYKVVADDADRGAKAIAADAFGDRFTKVVYLDQGWAASDSLWFYNITQGSDLMPYDMFLALERKGSQELFRSDENVNRYRYLPQKKTRGNPDGLPLGMVADTYHGTKYVGFTCAACHSSQVNYNGVGIRIDGGPAAADMDLFMKDLAESLNATYADPAKKQRFIAAVLKGGAWSDARQVEADLDKYALRIRAYNFINESTAPYGYSRLDAFGRIYNRVLEHVLNEEALRSVLVDVLPPSDLDRMLDKLKPVLSEENRDHVMGQLISALSKEQLQALHGKIFNSPNAPVSYPFVWDIPQHDYVQWNGIGDNAGVGPIGRNTGEVIGVFGTLDWSEKKGWTISSVLGGQGFGEKHISFESSVKTHNLRRIEDRLGSLESPLWTDAVKQAGLPQLNEESLKRGVRLFDKHCVACHARIDRASSQRRIVAHMERLGAGGGGTDETMANNGVTYAGYSGILRNQYVQASAVGSILLDTRAPAAALLTKATQNVVATPDPDKRFYRRASDWAIDLVSAFFSNEIKPSVKSGNYIPDTTSAPFESLRAYKARSLNGIWATAPYLHNGSVPTLYDLLLPAGHQPGDPDNLAYRPRKFMVGSRELDVAKVGFRHELNEYQGFLFDTTLPGNSNAGHEYGTRGLTDEDRRDLVEYLKSL
jgi:hypothetical protein